MLGAPATKPGRSGNPVLSQKPRASAPTGMHVSPGSLPRGGGPGPWGDKAVGLQTAATRQGPPWCSLLLLVCVSATVVC